MVKYGRYSLLGLIPLMIISLLRPMDMETTSNVRSDRSYEYDMPPIDIAIKQRPTNTITSASASTDLRISEEETPVAKIPPQDIIAKSKNIRQKPQLDEDIHSLSSYNASLYPVLPDYKPSKSSPLAVKFLVDVTKSIDAQSKFILDGLERSQYTKVVELLFQNRLELKTVQVDSMKSSEPYIWMVDWGSLNRDCHALERVVLQQNNDAAHSEPLAVVLMDFSASTRQVTCPKLVATLPTRLIKRQIVQGRHYNGTWVTVGEIVPNKGRKISSGPVLHSNMVVRELLVQSIPNDDTASHPNTRNRPIDVAIFWNEGDVSHYGFLRRRVTSIVQAMHKTKTGNRTIQAHVGAVGSNNNDQGVDIQLDYVDQLLDSKLVVVAQRDEWEDHLPLYDALASGALVLTDHMHTLPAGFSNKTNILVYDSPQSLKRLIRYYLHPNNSKKRKAIAKSGWKLATNRHRSFHRLEQVLFGKAMTLLKKDQPSPPKRDHPPVQVTNHESFYMR
jgi:hypothetical protein